MSIKKHSTEIKIGVSFIVALATAIIGINFLKGINLFTPANHYYLTFENIEGLVPSNGVFIKGHKVGQVRTIKYDFTKANSFVVDIAINDDIKLPIGTEAFLFDESLMGGKGINIVFEPSNGTAFHSTGDTLPSLVAKGLLATVGDLVPSLQNAVNHIDSLLVSADSLINSPAIRSSLNNIESVTKNLNYTTVRLNSLIDNDAKRILNNVDSLTKDISFITAQLKDVQYKDIFQSIDTSLYELKVFTEKVNSPDGSIGLLLNDTKLYDNLSSTAASADSLLIDLKANPKRYVHFSLFGRKEKKNKK